MIPNEGNLSRGSTGRGALEKTTEGKCWVMFSPRRPSQMGLTAKTFTLTA
jgi:hypothetical protein